MNVHDYWTLPPERRELLRDWYQLASTLPYATEEERAAHFVRLAAIGPDTLAERAEQRKKEVSHDGL